MALSQHVKKKKKKKKKKRSSSVHNSYGFCTALGPDSSFLASKSRANWFWRRRFLNEMVKFSHTCMDITRILAMF